MGAEGISHDAAATPVTDEVPPQPVDAWLERRLRVFERALAQLESRQDKTERKMARELAGFEARLVQPAPPVEAGAGSAEAVPLADSEPSLASSEGDMPQEDAPKEGTVASSAPPPEPEDVPGPLILPPWRPDSAMENEHAAAEALTQARRAAQAAAAGAAARRSSRRRRRKRRQARLFALGGALAALILACAGLIAGNVVGATRAQARSGIAHRQVAHGTARIVALADSGDAAAQTALALDYLQGNGVVADRAGARRWSRAAAAQGNPVAEYTFGALLFGSGRKAEAVRWFRAAALQGNVKAMHNLAIAYTEGLGVAKDPQQAVHWFALAAVHGYRDSAFDLAVLYERGDGVPQSAQAALEWYLVAARQGDGPSAARATVLRGQMRAADVARAERAAADFTFQPASRSANSIPSL